VCGKMYLTSPDDSETQALANELVNLAGKYGVDSYHGFGLSVQALCKSDARGPRRNIGDALLRFGEIIGGSVRCL
jgi:hypothetical protein